MFSVAQVRADFPMLERQVHPGVPLVYLDSTASSQKPVQVIAAMDDYYRHSHANIHRGIHVLAEEATALYEASRARVADFIGAPSSRQVIFTRNTTESINLVAYTWGRAFLNAGDVLVLTEMEHQSNLVPWHILSQERGVRLEFIPVTSDGLLGGELARRRGAVRAVAARHQPDHRPVGDELARDQQQRALPHAGADALLRRILAEHAVVAVHIRVTQGPALRALRARQPGEGPCGGEETPAVHARYSAVVRACLSQPLVTAARPRQHGNFPSALRGR